MSPGKALIEVTPPASVNRRRGAPWQQVRREKAALEGDIFKMLLAAKVPRPIPTERVHVTAVVRYPQRRVRDEGNVRAPLEKALGDVLKNGWIPDDTPEHFTFGALSFEVVAGLPALAAIALDWTLPFEGQNSDRG